MKRCPECLRDYYDETLLYCLDDGAHLVDGPATVDEPATAILSESRQVGIATGFRDGEPTRPQIQTTGAEAEPPPSFEEPAERQSLSAHRAAKPLAVLIVAVIVLVGGFFGYRYFSSSSSKQIESIAVMPFVNESGNADVEYLSDGMTEILIGSLSRLPNLNVKARTSVFRYKGKEIDPRQIGAELSVQAVLTGRVIQRGNSLTLFVELIDAATENVLWKADYNRSMTDLVSLQNEIAQDVSQKLRSRLTEAEAQKLTKKSDTTNPEAYRLYLQGRFLLGKQRLAETGQAIGYFQQAIALDPNYAAAYAGLADAVTHPSDAIPHSERAQKGREAASKALALDNELAEAHTALAHIMIRYDLDFAGAEQQLKRAIQLDPKWVEGYGRYGQLYSFLGRHDEALAKYRDGLELEPYNIVLNTNYGSALTYARRYDEAIAQLKKTLEMDPNFRNAHGALVVAYAMKGMYAESVKHRIRTLELAPMPEFAVRMREAFEKRGWVGVLEAEYDRLITSPERTVDRTPYYTEAVYLTLLGEKEKAFVVLDKSIAAGENPSLVFLKVEPRLDPLRDDPRFAELLKKVGFPP